jgi:hypothetical protein
MGSLFSSDEGPATECPVETPSVTTLEARRKKLTELHAKAAELKSETDVKTIAGYIAQIDADIIARERANVRATASAVASGELDEVRTLEERPDGSLC